MLQRAASNAYSWWWASHIRTKQSKWLDNHLQDMEHRVKCMLLLLGEEADSFSKRAEMYYKRRPEVITQVEEVYRAYRALADRYDIMSGELHKANHTIATAFPDQVQYAMLEEEDDNIPKAFTPVDPRKIHKSTVDGLMKKKKGEHPGSTGGGAKNSTSAPINKENAGEEISRLQKAILVMQTEKEFIKSSYESGIAKYWDLEKEINDMQEQVCHFQDKFDESVVIEDDEARALMTATALKSCEDTIMKLQEQRKASAGQAMGESERVKVFREKLKAIMNKHGKSLPDPLDFSDKNTRKNHGAEMEDAYHAKQGGIEMQAVIDKIKEHFERDCNISMAEVTERIDELVNKVVDLELMVSSQTSQIDRLCRENSELENSLQNLDDENTVLASGSSELTEKLRQVEEELTRVQALESSFHKDESTIRSNFVEAISRFSDISELLLSPVCEHHTGSVSAQTSHEAPVVESTEPSSNEYCDMKEVGLQIAEPHADNAGPASGVVQPDDPDDVLVAGTDDSSGSTKSSEQQLDAVQDKSSRERGSLVRLRHISSDNLGGYDEQEEMSKVGSSSADGITDMMKLQERLSDSLEDKEKALLGEYTSLLEEYKGAKRRLVEMEKKNQECLNEIRSLREEIASSAGEGGSEGSCKRSSSSCSRRGHRRTPSYSSVHQRRPSVSSISRLIRMGSTIQESGEPAGAEQQGGINLEDLRLPAVAEAENASPLEERFRRDIDTLLDENLEFWMKFSSSLQRVQEFQSKHEGLQLKLLNNKEEGKQDGATEKQLRALKTELQVWSEQNAMLRGELQCRFTSLCDIQEEITAALDMEADQFTSYQAAKFQGEVLNMQQENNRVSDELQAGLDHVKGLQAEVEQALGKLHIRSVSLPAQMAGADDSDPGGSGAGSGSGSTAQSLNDDILRSVFSRLDDHFDLARCSAVCSSWNRIIVTAHLMRDLYYKRNPPARGSNSNISVKSYFEALAMDEHASSLSNGPADAYQWVGHPMRATLCRMKGGSILTGVGDKILRLWSAETCKFMNEYNVPNAKTLVDFEFDENKIVGLTSSQICIWRRSEPRSIFQSSGASFNHGLCMSYADPEVVIGCEDGRAFVYDMYSRSCSSIYRLHSSPVTCLTITDDQLILGGSTFGNIAIADQTSGQKIGVLKSAYAPLAIRSLSFSTNSHMIFAGSSAGYAHCWDLRTLRPLWEQRVSPNVIYSAHHLPGDTTALAVGGIDGVLRLISQRTGEIIRSIVVDTDRPAEPTSRSRHQIEKKRVREVAADARVDNISTRLRPQITSLSVGIKKIVTTHGENYIRVLKFCPKNS